MSRMLDSIVMSLVASLFLVAGCGDDDGDGPAPECEEIFEACHDVDPGSGPIHECHESSEEAWSQSECQDNLEMCLEICAAAGVDAGAVDAP